ncbi:MAG: HEAT repeat domain-containing protein [Candidatus Bipolaricaulia bacterium]
MLQRLLSLLILLMFGAFGLSYAQIDQTLLIEEILELSGMKKQIERIPARVDAELAQRQTEMNREDYEKIRKIMVESYRYDAVYRAVVDKFTDNFDQIRLLTVLNQLHSPVFQKIFQLETQASTLEAIQEMEKFAAQLQSNPPTQERLALVQRLDEATGTTELSFEMSLAIFRGMVKAFDPILPPEERKELEELEQLVNDMVNDMRSQLQPLLKNNTWVSFLYTYRSASDEELTQYIDFWESDLGQWFIGVSSAAIIEAMGTAAEEVGTQLVKVLQEQEQPTQARSAALVLPQALEDKDERVRPAAAETSVNISSEPTRYRVQPGDSLWKIAVQFYGDGDKWTVIAEVNGISVGTPRSLRRGEVLIIPDLQADTVLASPQALEDEDERVRPPAGSDVLTPVSTLAKALRDADWRVRADAAGALGRMGPATRDAVPALVEALNDTNLDVRWQAAWALGEIDPDAREAVPALIEALQDVEVFVRAAAAGALGKIGPATAQDAILALTEALQDTDWRVRANAAGALGKIGPAARDAVPALTEALTDEHEHVRQVAAGALESIRRGQE